MNTNKIILSLPPRAQEGLFTGLLRTGRLWKIPQFACLARWFVMSGASERAMDHAVRHTRSWDAWVAFWLEEGERTVTRAERELEAGHLMTARERFQAASAAFAMALWQTPDVERRAQIYPRLRTSFEQFGRLTTPPPIIVEIPFEPAPLPGHLRLPYEPIGVAALPVVVLIQGMDTIKETMGLTEAALLARGLATLTVEQPGTGEARMRGVCLTGHESLEAAAHAIADFVSARPEFDPERLGIFGVSFGGFVAPYFAGVESRFKVLGVLGAMWEFPHPRGMAGNPFYGDVMRLMTGLQDREQVAHVFEQLKLAPVAGEIRAATAILQGLDDLLFVEGSRQLYEAITVEKKLRLIEGGDHGLTWHPEELPFLADWFADHLLGGQSGKARARMSVPVPAAVV